jgi:uncharacterized protein (TIGR04255 family)
MMRLDKPPVVETWIGYRFERRPDSLEVFPDSARTFLSAHTSEYPEAEYQVEQQVTIQGGSPKELPKTIGQKIEISRIKSFNVDKTRCIQFSKEHMVYSAVKTAALYPGYETVRDESLALLSEYVQQTDPVHIRSAALFYKDIVEISSPGLRIDNLTAYFQIAPDFSSETFGDTAFFRYQHVFQCPVDEGPLIQTLQPLPTDLDSAIMKFEMTWLKVCEKLNTLDEGEIRRRLDIVHEYLRRCFRASVTDATWQLFEPQDD